MMDMIQPVSPLSWTENPSSIGKGSSAEREATDAERAALRTALGIVAVERLTTAYRVTPIAGGGFRVAGETNAVVTQSCIITLAPVAGRIAESFDVEFWPDIHAPAEEGELSALDAREVEPLAAGLIDVGRIVFETIAAGLNPYPRASDAEFEWSDTKVSDPDKTSPFAALAKLKPKD